MNKLQEKIKDKKDLLWYCTEYKRFYIYSTGIYKNLSGLGHNCIGVKSSWIPCPVQLENNVEINYDLRIVHGILKNVARKIIKKEAVVELSILTSTNGLTILRVDSRELLLLLAERTKILTFN